MAGPAVVVVEAGGLAVTNLGAVGATPFTVVENGLGIAVTLVDSGGLPVTLLNEDGSLWAALPAPVLTWVSGVTDNEPNFSVDLPVEAQPGDEIEIRISDNVGFAGAPVETELGTVVGDPVAMEAGVLADGTYWARARYTNSAWSNVETKTIDATAPTITSSNSLSVAENSAFSHTLTANETVTWTKTGGADTALFTLAGTNLSMTAKDYETPTDADANNTYVVQVTATDTAGNATNQTITVTVTDVSDAPAYVGPGDVVGSANFFWGLRAYNAASIGNNIVDIIRASDSATQTFVSVAGGGVDIASITTFLAATTGKVTRLYDQIGTNHLVQATDAARPTFTLNGGNNLPCVTFAGAQKLTGVANLSAIQETTQSAVARRTGDFSANSAIFGSADFDTVIFFAGANELKIYANGTDLPATAADNAWHAINGIFTDAGTSSSVTIDGATTSGTIGNDAFGQSTTAPQMGQATGANFPLTGGVREVIVYTGNKTGTQVTNLDSNQRTYWGF